MKLSELIEGIEPAKVAGDASVEITGIAIDSRAVDPGALFVALRGTAVDGHEFVEDAVARGASALITDHALPSSAVPVVVVSDTAKALARVAARLFGDPAAELRMCGVTGTNGKTSTAHILRSIAGASSLGKMGVVGTLGHGYETLTATPHTTPDAVTLHCLFREMVDNGVIGVVMEVSSHAVRQHRTWGLDFEVGILTNVTHDHLDYHKTMEDYRAAKAEFCHSLVAPGRSKPQGTLVYSCDDAVADSIGQEFPGRAVSVGNSAEANVRIRSVEATLSGTRVELRLQDGSDVSANMKLLGTFVAANASLAAAAALELGCEVEAVRSGLEAIDRIPGRFEALGGGGKPTVIIDYSHTADAMERVLSTCRELEPDRLTTVFGCGGDRDRSKRPLMGGVAERLSDRCFLTTDNPRSERVEDIVADILSGMSGGGAEVELDRARAIARAIASSGPGDVVALLGKGHEPYQIVGTERLPFDERSEAEAALRAWRKP
jgi:UDP-N-acetylmuramoyl-L-alanyl-D-glutamate--2,6-diaminopimelate ligase